MISIPCTRNFIFLSAPSRLTVESQCLHLSLWMSSLVVVSALHPPASPSPHVLTEVSYLLLGKSMRLSARRPLVESAQLLTVACDLSRVSSSAISADGCGSLVRPPLVPRFQSVAPTTYEVIPCPKDLATKALLLSPDFSVSGHHSLRPHRCPPLASDLSGMRPWSTFLVRVRSCPDRLREYTDNAKEA